MVVEVTFVLLTNLARAGPRKMSGWDFPRRQTETGKTPILLTTVPQVLCHYPQVTNFFFIERGPLGCTMTPAFLLLPLLLLLYRNRVTFSRLLA